MASIVKVLQGAETDAQKTLSQSAHNDGVVDLLSSPSLAVGSYATTHELSNIHKNLSTSQPEFSFSISLNPAPASQISQSTVEQSKNNQALSVGAASSFSEPSKVNEEIAGFIKPTAQSNDGKFSWREAGRNFLNGVTSIAHTVIEHPWKSAAVVGAGIAAVVAAPAAGVVLVAVGVAIGSYQMGKAAYQFTTAKDGDAKERAFYSAGAGTTNLLLAGVSSTSALKAAGMASEGNAAANTIAAVKAAPNAAVMVGSAIKSGEAKANLLAAAKVVTSYATSVAVSASGSNAKAEAGIPTATTAATAVKIEETLPAETIVPNTAAPPIAQAVIPKNPPAPNTSTTEMNPPSAVLKPTANVLAETAQEAAVNGALPTAVNSTAPTIAQVRIVGRDPADIIRDYGPPPIKITNPAKTKGDPHIAGKPGSEYERVIWPLEKAKATGEFEGQPVTSVRQIEEYFHTDPDKTHGPSWRLNAKIGSQQVTLVKPDPNNLQNIVTIGGRTFEAVPKGEGKPWSVAEAAKKTNTATPEQMNLLARGHFPPNDPDLMVESN